MNKRPLIVFALLLVALAVFVSCNTATTVTNTAGTAAQGATKLGIGTVIRTDKSVAPGTKDGKDTDGNAQTDAIISTVILGSDGKIVKCDIESIQQKIAFDKTGALKGDIKALGKTKTEIGADYGMAKNSPIGKEWFEQIKDLEAWMVGKTEADLNTAKGKLAEGKTTEADLKTKVTISITDYIDATIKAIKNAA